MKRATGPMNSVNTQWTATQRLAALGTATCLLFREGGRGQTEGRMGRKGEGKEESVTEEERGRIASRRRDVQKRHKQGDKEA